MKKWISMVAVLAVMFMGIGMSYAAERAHDRKQDGPGINCPNPACTGDCPYCNR
ncbi:hypothetical protein [Desulforhabdus sp. TSK]|uniref:hypothetical protein n=1 Tax=Desulforhabdus sp. TSK TaxID=2925014 RepID=UPI001FC87FF2|nr:hypothetical protein [Desulforhabdus sp. TSK]GKT07066.1 hypothetical protein DSTSK_03710 [Desulforhabdus sp. TSK]